MVCTRSESVGGRCAREKAGQIFGQYRNFNGRLSAAALLQHLVPRLHTRKNRNAGHGRLSAHLFHLCPGDRHLHQRRQPFRHTYGGRRARFPGLYPALPAIFSGRQLCRRRCPVDWVGLPRAALFGPFQRASPAPARAGPTIYGGLCLFEGIFLRHPKQRRSCYRGTDGTVYHHWHNDRLLLDLYPFQRAHARFHSGGSGFLRGGLPGVSHHDAQTAAQML